jgi:hypothetical protein
VYSNYSENIIPPIDVYKGKTRLLWITNDVLTKNTKKYCKLECENETKYLLWVSKRLSEKNHKLISSYESLEVKLVEICNHS